MKASRKGLFVAGTTVGLGLMGAFGASPAQAKGFAVIGSAGQVRSALLSEQNAVVEGQFAADTSSSGKKVGEGKCGEGKCGENKDHKKSAEGKCGEGKCGGEKKEHKGGAEGKCGEGKCGK